MILTTGRVQEMSTPKYYGTRCLDITVKSGLKLFAPTWEMVRAFKNGTLSEEEYTEQYKALMRQSYKEHKGTWGRVLIDNRNSTLVLCCYCKKGDFCHRHILADILETLAKDIGVEVIRREEV